MPTSIHSPKNTEHHPIRMAEILAAFSLATDLGTGKSMGHAVRACYIGMQIADELCLSSTEWQNCTIAFSSCIRVVLGCR